MQLGISFRFRVIGAAFAVAEHLLGRQLDSQVSDPAQNHVRFVSFLACSVGDDKRSAQTFCDELRDVQPVYFLDDKSKTFTYTFICCIIHYSSKEFKGESWPFLNFFIYRSKQWYPTMDGYVYIRLSIRYAAARV